MEANPFDPSALAERHFGGARLWDKRRTRRLVKTAGLLMARPQPDGGGTLPRKLPDRADLVGLYRLLDCGRVTHAAVLGPHRQRTLEAMRAHQGVVLVIHDTTELDFTHVDALAGQVGQVGNGGGRGYLCHNSLAVGLAPGGGREVLGLANQVLHRRRRVPRGETPSRKRSHPGRESRLWPRGCEGVGPAPSPGGPGAALWVDVCDRGADAIEFIEYEVRNGRHFVIRCAKDRNLDCEDFDHVGRHGDRIHRKLLAYARDLPALGARELAVPAAAGKSKARAATVSVSAGPLRLRAGRFARGECRGLPLDLWVVHVLEADPPPGVAPLEWVLLTDLPADTFGKACERADWYGHRPTIEDYHKGMKTGAGVERPRFQEASRLEPLVALLSVVAAVLLSLRDAGAGADARPATDLVPPLYVKVLAARSAARAREKGPRSRPPVTEGMSVREFVTEVAKLGGFMARKCDGHPGWQTLWRGWAALQLLADGARAMIDQRCVYQ
jgi:hypothetical protein